MRILIIEDNRQIAIALKEGLRSQYAVDIVLTGDDGLHQAQATAYDVILLDLNLPDIPGATICQKLRKSGISTPIIVITGRDLLADKINLLDLGADDYITKPFKIAEVEARIRLALRHNAPKATSSILVADDLKLNPAARSVERGKQIITLRRKEFDLLEYLMRNQGQTLTRSMIMEHIWDMSENLWANVVDVHIKHLRDKIDRPFHTKLIQTVHGVGYKLQVTRDGSR